MKNIENFEKLIKFLHEIEPIKYKLRFGSSKNKLNESIAAHSWKLAIMVFVFTEELNLKLNILKSMKLALIHDVVDVDARRIVKKEMSEKEKNSLEEKEIIRLSKTLPEIKNLWREYKNGLTQEAKYVQALAKLETLMHIIDTGYQTYNMPEMIPNYADNYVNKFPQLAPVLKELKLDLKKEFKKGKIPWKKEYDA